MEPKRNANRTCFLYKQSELFSNLRTSFSKWDKNTLTYSHSTFNREDNDIEKRKSISDQFILTDEIHFDKDHKYNLNIVTSALDRKLSNKYTRVNTSENFRAELPNNFNLSCNYSFYYILQESQKLNQHNVDFVVGHKLYKSLNTDIFGGYNNAAQSLYKGHDTKLGFDIRYVKKLPLNGKLALSYRFSWNHRKKESESVSLNIFNEEYTLDDADITLLDKPYIDIQSIVVTDVTGTIIYQPNFDYILVPQNNYIEIQRVPGGLIANNSTVYIDYTVIQPGLYKYDAANHNFRASISFFKNIVEVYYAFSSQNYLKLMQTEFLNLNTFSQNTCGLRLNYQFAAAGIEYDNYKSTIIPYHALSYYVQMQGKFLKNFEGSLNGNMRYVTLTDEKIKQNSASVSAMLAYNIRSKTRISLQGNYVHQKYRSINLELLTATADVTTSIRQIYFTVGYQLYRRNYLNERIYYNGGFIQIARRF